MIYICIHLSIDLYIYLSDSIYTYTNIHIFTSIYICIKLKISTHPYTYILIELSLLTFISTLCCKWLTEGGSDGGVVDEELVVHHLELLVAAHAQVWSSQTLMEYNGLTCPYLLIYLSIYLSISITNSLSLPLSVYNIFLSIYPLIFLSTSPSIYLSVCIYSFPSLTNNGSVCDVGKLLDDEP